MIVFCLNKINDDRTIFFLFLGYLSPFPFLSLSLSLSLSHSLSLFLSFFLSLSFSPPLPSLFPSSLHPSLSLYLLLSLSPSLSPSPPLSPWASSPCWTKSAGSPRLLTRVLLRSYTESTARTQSTSSQTSGPRPTSLCNIMLEM